MTRLTVFEATCCGVPQYLKRATGRQCVRCSRELAGVHVPVTRIAVKLFERRFVVRIQTGAKVTTLRPERRNPHRIGDVLDMRHWRGVAYRSPQVRIMGAVVIDYTPCTLFHDGYQIDGVRVAMTADLQRFAREDGFNSWAELQDWFTLRYVLPFQGWLTRWRPLR